MYNLSYLCLVFVMLMRLFIAALWSPAGKGVTYWILFVMFNCVFVAFPCGILGHMWHLIVSIPDLCRLSYFLWWHITICSFCQKCIQINWACKPVKAVISSDNTFVILTLNIPIYTLH